MCCGALGNGLLQLEAWQMSSWLACLQACGTTQRPPVLLHLASQTYTHKSKHPRMAWFTQVHIQDADNGLEAINADFVTAQNISFSYTAPRQACCCCCRRCCEGGRRGITVQSWQHLAHCDIAAAAPAAATLLSCPVRRHPHAGASRRPLRTAAATTGSGPPPAAMCSLQSERKGRKLDAES